MTDVKELPFYSAYNPPPRVRARTVGPSRTKQADKQGADVNFIVQQFQKTGSMHHLRKHEGTYTEYESIDYHECMNKVVKANEMFMSLPSSVRNRFHNDPAEFLEFATNEDNLNEMVDMGLAYKQSPTTVVSTEGTSTEAGETTSESESTSAE